MVAVAHGWCWTLLASATVDNQCCVTRARLARCWLMRHRGLDPLWTKTTVSPTLLWLRANHKQPQAVLVHGRRKTVYTANHRVRLLVTPSATLRLPPTWFNPFVGVSPKPIHLPAVATALRWSYHHSPNGCDATHFRNGLGGLRGPP